MEICRDLLGFTPGFRLRGVAIEKRKEPLRLEAIMDGRGVEAKLVMQITTLPPSRASSYRRDRISRHAYICRGGANTAMCHLMSYRNRLDDGAQSFCEVTSVESHAKIFGVSLALVLTICLTLSAVSSSTRVSQRSDRPFATSGAISVSASRSAVSALANGPQLKLGGSAPVNGQQQ
jgi:hypothetical protein